MSNYCLSMIIINSIKYFVFPFLCLFPLLTSFSCSPNGESKKAVVIRVGDRVFTVADIEKEVTITSIENGVLTTVIRSSINELVNRMVDDALVLEYGKASGIAFQEIELEKAVQNIVNDYPDNSFNEMLLSMCIDYNEWKKRLGDRLVIEKIIKEQTASLPPISHHAITSYYQERKEDFSHPSRAKFVHILTQRRKEAEAVLARLKGGVDIQELVRENSLGPGIYKDDGTHWKNKYILPAPLSDIIFSIPIGTLSKIIKTPYGFHIIKVLEREPPGLKDLLEVRAEIEKRLREKTIEKHYKVWLNELRNNYPVKVNDTLLDKIRRGNEKK